MKKLFLFSFILFTCNISYSQSKLSNGSVPGPIKFADVISQHKNQLKTQIDKDDEDARVAGYLQKEGKDHIFQKWEWYWKQHLDQNGYLVPTNRNITEWEKYLNNSNRKAAKTTSAYPAHWQFVGPSTTPGGYAGIGRLNTVAFDPIDSNIVFVGAAGGGTWKTTDGGNTWSSCYDNLPTLGVTDIKINPLNHNTIYVATGDADAWDAYCSGVIKSYDGGMTWHTTGLTWLPTDYYSARSLIINPLDTNTMVLATNGGIYKSYNAGTSWASVATGDFKQILYKPNDTNIIYGTVYVYSSSAQIVRSVNGGNTWSTITSFTDAQRINIAVCPSSPSIVYAIASNNSSGLKGIYNSTDNGASYTAVYLNDSTCVNNLLSYDLGLPTTSCGGQGWYDLCIAVNPFNSNEVTVGGVNTYYSSDGGFSWQIANTWYDGGSGVGVVHADKHCLAYNQLTGALFETCDGGVYKNYGPVTAPWVNLCSGICATEFYRNAIDNNANFSIGGAQDNGTKMVSVTGSNDLTGGDGMQPLINYGNPNNIFYTSCQNGYIMETRDGGSTFFSISDTIHSSGGWISPFVLHPTDTATLLLGFRNVYITHNNGISWSPMSPIFDSNSYLNVVQISKANPNYVYTVYDDYSIWKSVIYYTTNFGTSWDTISIPFSTMISDLVIDPLNENKIWVTVGNYASADKVYQYNLTTNTWTNETGTLPNLPVNCILIDTSNQTKYIGTDAAVFFRESTATDWTLFNSNLPCVHVTDLNINYTSGVLWAATYGRGMWKSNKSDIPVQVEKLGTDFGVTISPNPCHNSFTIVTKNNLVSETDINIKLISVDGKTVLNTIEKFDGNGKLKISINGIQSGFYICEISNGETLLRNKVVVY